ncbi:MAG: HAD-IA family hydrolase, partial [Hyphomicrobiales bacterium]|nr:HAD-IA family hydrolase [Hyphomicrobiales bacterium]
MSKSRPTLVLDLDGTLVDTARDLTATLNAILANEDLAPIAHGKARAMVGHGARAMLESALRDQRQVPESDYLDRLLNDFIAHYADHLADRSQPFPGATKALDRFADAQWRLGVCTNKLEGLSVSLLERLELAAHFAAIAGQDTFTTRKPDPGHLLQTIEQAGGEHERAVMVGDSEVDVATARAAGVPVIAVSFGYSQILPA